MESFYQGALDVFLAKVRADFDAIELQSTKAISNLETNGLLRSETMPNALFTEVSNISDDGDRAVWRHISVAGSDNLGTRKAGGAFPEANIQRGYETVAVDPDLQDATAFAVPEERQDKEGTKYKAILDRALMLMNKTRFKNVGDPFDVFNYGFTAPTSYPVRFTARGNMGSDGNYTALGERLFSTVHARADSGATQSNAVTASGLMAPLTITNYNAALEQGYTFKDDVGDPTPRFGGTKAMIVVPAQGLVQTAKEIMGSEWKPYTANNEVNVFKNDFGQIISSPYLRSSYNGATIVTSSWYLADTANQDPTVGTGLVRVCFIPLNSRVERDQFKQAILYQVKQSYVYVWVDWRNLLGSKGDNTAYSS